MAGGLTVRPAAPDDVPAIVALLVAGSRMPEVEAPGEPARYVEAIERIREAHGEVLVAAQDGAVLGVVQLMLLAHLQHAGGSVAEVESVHVAASRRRDGIGRALLEAAVAWAVDRGCYRIQLTSHRSRDGAHRFYEAIGFEPTHVGYKRLLGPSDTQSPS